MTTKPGLNRVWASGAPSANIEDPDETVAGKFASGWQAEIPPFQNFNFLQQLFTQALAHANEFGIMQWDNSTTYPVNGWARSTVDGAVYRSKVSNSANEPSDSPTEWEVLSVQNLLGIPNDWTALQTFAAGINVSGFTSTGIEDNADDTAVTITPNNNVGVGTDSPDTPMHITRGVLEELISRASATLTLENSGDTELYLASGSTSTGQLRFGNPNSNFKGAISYDHINDEFIFYTNGSNAATLDTGGHLIIPAGITLGTSSGIYNEFNTLSDYEDGGTWTPIVGGTATYRDSNGGRYTKIGNKVFIEGHLSIDDIGTGNNATILGLPFAQTSISPPSSIAVGYWAGLSPAPSFVAGNVGGNAVFIRHTVEASSSMSAGPLLVSGSDLYFTAAYTTD